MGLVKSKNILTCQERCKKSSENSENEPVFKMRYTCAKKHRKKRWKLIKGKHYCTNTKTVSTDHPSEHYNTCLHTTGSLRFDTSFDSIKEESSAQTHVKRPALQEANNTQNVEFHQKHIDNVRCEFKPLHGDDRSEANFDIETQRNSTEQFHWLTLSSMNTERMNPSSKLFSEGICSLDEEPERYTEEPSLNHLKELSQNNETKHVDSTIPKQLYQNGSISDTDSKENNNFAFQSIDYMKSCTRYQESSDMSASYSSSLPLSSHDDFVLKVEVAKKDAACQVGCGLLGPSDQTVNQDNGSTSAQSCHHSPENQSRFKLDIEGSAKCNSAAESKIVESCDDDTKQKSLFCREVESIYATENEMKYLEGIENPKNEKRATSVESSKQANCLEIDNTMFNRIDHDNQSYLKRKYETICNNEERMSSSCSKLNKVSTAQVSIKKQKLGKDNDSQIVGSPTSLKMDIEKKVEDDIIDENYLKVMSDHDLFNAEEYDAVLPYSSHSSNVSKNKNVSQMNEEDQQMHEKDTAMNTEHTEDSIDMNNQFTANEIQVIDKKQDNIDEGFFLVEDDTSNVHGEEDQTLSHGYTEEQGLHDKHHAIAHIIVDTFQGNSRSKFNGKQQEKDHNTFKGKALNRDQCKLHLIKTDVCTVKKECGKKSGNKQRLKDTLKKTCSEKKDRFPHPEIDNEMSDEILANTMKRTPVYSVDSGVFNEFELCRSTSLSLYKSIKNESEVLKKIELLEKKKENYSTKMKLSHKRSLVSMTTCFFNIEKRLKEMSKTMIDWSYFRPGFDEYAVFLGLASYFQRLQSGPPPSMEEQMTYEWFRFTSFGSSYNGNGSALVLARNGFYHEPERGSTATRCFACHVRHSTWNSFENVEEVHHQLSHYCPHVNQNDSASGNVSITQSDSPENRPNMSALNTTEANVITLGAEGGSTNENSLASQLENMVLKASSNEDRQPSQPTEDAENIHFGSSSLVLSHQSEHAVEGRTGDVYPNRPSRIPRFATTNNNLAVGARTNTTGTPTISASQPSQPSTPGGPTESQPNQGPAGNSAGLNNASAIVVQSPNHPDYASLERRTESFSGWPSYLDQTSLQMASAGLFYAGVADFTRCYCCGGGLRNWRPGDNPVLEHTRRFSTCEYVKKLKGDRYVQAVVRREGRHLREREKRLRLSEQNGTADTTSQPQTSTGKKINGHEKKGNRKPPTVAVSLLGDAVPSDLDIQSLKEENEKLRERQTCKICMERPRNMTFLPCGHLVCCEQCAPRLVKCPICRVKIKRTVKTFMS